MEEFNEIMDIIEDDEFQQNGTQGLEDFEGQYYYIVEMMENKE